MANIIYKTFRVDVKAVNEETGEIDMLIPMSTASIDRDGESINPMGWKKSLPAFKKRPVLLSSHDYRDLRKQIGEFTQIKVNPDGLFAKPKYYINEGNEEADWAFKLASKGVAAYSVGFIPIKWTDGDWTGEDGKSTKPRRTYEEQELLEISHVVVPSNRDAIQSLRATNTDPVIKGLLDEVEKELPEPEIIEDKVTKPEEDDEYIRIPVRTCEVTATIDISKKEGISALYCGKEKQVATYLFAKDHEWTMAKAKKWVKEHEKKIAHDVSQAEIIDEIDYLTTLIKENGMNEDVKSSALEFVQKVIVQLKEEIPEDNAEIMIAIGAKVLGYDVPVASYTMGKDGKPIKGIDLRRPGGDIPVKDNIKESLKLLDEIIKEQLEVN